jgi:hypothetical protein
VGSQNRWAARSGGNRRSTRSEALERGWFGVAALGRLSGWALDCYRRAAVAQPVRAKGPVLPCGLNSTGGLAEISLFQLTNSFPNIQCRLNLRNRKTKFPNLQKFPNFGRW